MYRLSKLLGCRVFGVWVFRELRETKVSGGLSVRFRGGACAG